MTRRRHKNHRGIKWLMFLILVAAVGGGIFYVAQYTDFFQTARVVPPLPVFADCSVVEAEVNKYDWDRELAVAVAKAESGCDVNAHGDEDLIFYDCTPEYEGDLAACKEHERRYGYSVGVFQVRILPGREKCDTYDVGVNVACAYEIYQERNNSFKPWSGWTTGKYKKYLWHTVGEVGADR